MNRSDHFDGKHFSNPVPTEMMTGNTSYPKMILEWFKKHPGAEPEQPLGPFAFKPGSTGSDALQITWLGHSSNLVRIEGKTFLTDPLWYQRVSPFSFFGPKRFFENPLAKKDLPHIDFILLSHDHYDHLDKEAMIWLGTKNIPIITLPGVGKRLINWGINPSLVTELDWWEQTQRDGLIITTAPTRHFSGRGLRDRFTTLWGAFAIKGKEQSVFYGADSGYFPGFKSIGEKLGPFDLTMLEIGAYNEAWADIHMGPENAVQAHIDLKGKVMLPIHWGTFALAFHHWKEPAERVIAEAEKKNLVLLLPVPGETVAVTGDRYISNWWESYR